MRNRGTGTIRTCSSSGRSEGTAAPPHALDADEQYTHITLWCLLSAPLLIGCDMTQLDDFTASLLCNDEVLEVSQDPSGRQASRVRAEGDIEVWAKELETGRRPSASLTGGSGNQTPASHGRIWD